jgi:acyl-CoA synthetase (AMP-forming)/AMP-acid ligase II
VDALTQPNAPDETCSALYGVPTHFLEILQEIENRTLTTSHLGGRLRTGIASGSPVPMELMRALRDRMGIDGLSVAYGMSNTLLLFANAELIRTTSRNEVNSQPTTFTRSSSL